MEPIVQEALLGLRDQAGDAEYVFTNPDTGTRYTDIKKSFSAACREAGITNFTFHDLRHTFASRLVMAGVALPTVQALMGHKTIAMTLRYTHLTMGHKQRAVRLLESVTEKAPAIFTTSQVWQSSSRS